ncbi:sensor histidine kinase [Arcticibacter tournemirensis]|uniref:histidine kinase n=1 Tax=Arcticibacter tournemirensis TaxID=699437 RepID=A0A4V1KIZ3_9SPHI|nr:ATP-binding protein [Arcticibacter tournemirensis]RXF72392.1 PAS domain S-box protein [Arcticibacter tournemirensis]
MPLENGEYFMEYRKLEEALERQNKLIRTITENATTALFTMNTEGYCTYMNPAGERMFGYTAEEIASTPLHNLIHSRRPDGSLYPIEECPIDRALPEHTTVRAHEDVFFRKDGSPVPVSCSISPVYENGHPVITVLEVHDLTEQKKHEEAILRNTKNLEILNSIGKSISAEMDLRNILQKVTDASTNLTGAQFGAFFFNTVKTKGESYLLYTLSGATADTFKGFPMPGKTPLFHPTFNGERVIRSDDITMDPHFGHNYHNGMPGGHLPVVSYLAVPVIAKSGAVIGGLFFGHSRPGTFSTEDEKMVSSIASQAAIAIDNAKLFDKVKTANRQNKRLLKIAKQLDDKKNEFMSIASHELKTPVTSIKGYLQIIEKIAKAEEKPILNGFITKAARQVDKLTSLVNDLLDATRIQAGKITYNFTKFNFGDVLEDSISSLRVVNNTHTIEINGDQNIFITADRIRLEQVISNLLSNAVKYSPEADKIILNVNQEEEILKVEIIDFGIGISEHTIPNIFDRYFREIDKNYQFNGLGLGLYISAEIIKGHNGMIWVESEPGMGATFSFTIPVNQTT